MHNKEFDSLRTAFNFAKYLKNVIVKVTDFETSAAKANLAEELLSVQIKFIKSLICSKLARPNLTPDMISSINNRSQQCSQRIVEDSLFSDENKLEEHIEFQIEDIVITHKRKIRNEIINDKESSEEEIFDNL